jgi:hypothetical protein
MDEWWRLSVLAPAKRGSATADVGQRIRKGFAPAHIWGAQKVMQVEPLARRRKGWARKLTKEIFSPICLFKIICHPHGPGFAALIIACPDFQEHPFLPLSK